MPRVPPRIGHPIREQPSALFHKRFGRLLLPPRVPYTRREPEQRVIRGNGQLVAITDRRLNWSQRRLIRCTSLLNPTQLQ